MEHVRNATDTMTKNSPAMPSFLFAICSVTAVCTLVGMSGFAIGIIVRSTQEPRLFDAATRQRIYVLFDGGMWLWIALAMFIPHTQVQNRRLWHHWQLRTCSGIAVLWILASHSFWLTFPHRDEMEVINNLTAFLLINVIPLIVSKWLLHRESSVSPPATRKSSSRVDPIPSGERHSTLMFPGIIVGLTSYGVSITMTDPIFRATCLILSLLTGAAVCVTALKYRSRLKLHFDYVLMLWCAYFAAPVARRAVLVLSDTALGKRFPIILIYGYRGLISAFIILFDEVMEATFGQWPQSLWGTFFMRLIESLVSFSLALNTIRSTTGIITYVGTNVATTILKDSGLLDDLRFVSSNGYCVWSPNHNHNSATTKRPNVFKTMRSFPSGKSSQNQTSSAAMPSAPVPLDVSALSTDLAIQIERSELTLISRVSSFICVTACYGLAQLWQRTSASSQVALLQTDEHKEAALLLLLLSLADLVLSRAVTAAIMQHKIRRLQEIVGLANTAVVTSSDADGRPPKSQRQESAPVLTLSLASSLVMSPIPSMQRIIPEAAKELLVDPRTLSSKHVLWETGLPCAKSFKRLVFALITFSTLVHFGAW
ncbi:hypothetical protein BCR44DRAFT_63330 [Catenaria anguillulae PL171]|uniref:Uncharacterized protein n=1 Tax=Catenaria anguillulae PL171 TaxID=765915 RepID=A0A1Y2HPB6_9FUNG|nr:hypothetical protein BCR44DRAFT_63330 [Catenaria anguillulae PL171]